MFKYELEQTTKVNGKDIISIETFFDYDLAIHRFYEVKEIVDTAQLYRYKEKDGKYILDILTASF